VICLWKKEKINNKNKKNRVKSPASSTQKGITKWNSFCDLIDISVIESRSKPKTLSTSFSIFFHLHILILRSSFFLFKYHANRSVSENGFLSVRLKLFKVDMWFRSKVIQDTERINSGQSWWKEVINSNQIWLWVDGFQAVRTNDHNYDKENRHWYYCKS